MFNKKNMCREPTLEELEEIEKEYNDILNIEVNFLLNEKSDEIKKILSTNDLEYIKQKLDIEIKIDIENKKVSLFNKNWILIWEIKPWNHSWTIKIDHLYKYIKSDYRWKWLGSLIFNIYKEKIWIPKTEISSKISWIRFLLNHWYKLESKLIWMEFQTEWINKDLEYIKSIDYNFDIDDDLWTIYRLVL